MNFLDRWVFPEYKTDPELLLRGRIIVGLSYFNMLLCFAAQFVLYMTITRHIDQLSLGHSIVLFFLLFYTGLLFSFRQFGSFFWTGNTLCLASYMGTMLAVYIGGTYPAPLGMVVVLVPVLAFLVPGQKSGLFWTAMVVLSEIAFAYFADSPYWGAQAAIMLEQAIVPGTLLVTTMTVGIIAGAFYIIDKLNLDLRQELFVERRLLEYTAAHDGLTGLYNRRAFDTIFKDLTSRSASEPFALLYLDLNAFKPINDNLGHETGDQFLQAFSDRLLRATRDNDVVARMGGDEFAIIIKHVSQTHQVERVLQQVLLETQKPLKLSGSPLQMESSIGVAFWPMHGSSPKELFKKADQAMYESKRCGSPYKFCPITML